MATKVEYDGVNASVRVSGQNVGANQFVSLGAYHTSEIASGMTVTLTKVSWDAGHREALTAEKKGGEVNVLLFQDDAAWKARIYALSGSLSRHIGSVDVTRPKSDVGKAKAREKWISQIRKTLLDVIDWSTCRCIAVCGPGAAEFLDQLKKDDEDPLSKASREKKLVAVEKRQGGISTEVLETLLAEKAIAALVSDTALAAHYEALEKFRAVELKDPDRVIYGSLVAAKEAADRAAIATLLILDERLKNARDVQERRSVAALIDCVHTVGGKTAVVLVFPKNHVTAQRLRNLGGVAAVLRFPCPDLQDITDLPADDDTRTVETTAVRTTTTAKHVEVKTKAASAKKKASASKQKKPPKPKLAADDDDYCDDDYYDY